MFGLYLKTLSEIFRFFVFRKEDVILCQNMPGKFVFSQKNLKMPSFENSLRKLPGAISLQSFTQNIFVTFIFYLDIRIEKNFSFQNIPQTCYISYQSMF